MTTPRHIEFPSMLNIDIAGDFTSIPSISAISSYDEATGTYSSASLTVTHPLIKVNATLLRRLHLRDKLAKAIKALLAESNSDLLKRPALKSYMHSKPGRAVSEKVAEAPTVDHLLDAAAVYTIARAVGEYPVKAIERTFGLDNDHATVWARLARVQGLIR